MSTYQTLSVLLRFQSQMRLPSGHNKSEDTVCDGIHYCNLPIAISLYQAWPGIGVPFLLLQPTFAYPIFRLLSKLMYCQC